MFKLTEIECFFNDFCSFDVLVKDTEEYIKTVLKNAENSFFYDPETDDDILSNEEIELIRNAKIEYIETRVLFNRIYCKPCFRLVYYLYVDGNDDTQLPQFTYEVEYNMNKEFSDEYFLVY